MRSRIVRVQTCSLIVVALQLGCIHTSPGNSFSGPLPELSPAQATIRNELQTDVYEFSDNVGPRCSLRSLHEAQNWIEKKLELPGVTVQLVEVDMNGPKVANVEATIRGTKRPGEIVLLGAHYDTVPRSPGANDNASGVAALLTLARRLPQINPERTVKLVFFVNEENPYSFGIQMGSRVYAEECRRRGYNIVAMVCIDSLGYYSDAAGSQKYPALVGWQLPSRANFVAFASDVKNQRLMDTVVALYRSSVNFPSLGVALDSKSVARSDHASFWAVDYPAIMMSDTSDYRDPHYHSPTDKPDNLNYDCFARVVDGLQKTVQRMSQSDWHVK